MEPISPPAEGFVEIHFGLTFGDGSVRGEDNTRKARVKAIFLAIVEARISCEKREFNYRKEYTQERCDKTQSIPE